MRAEFLIHKMYIQLNLAHAHMSHTHFRIDNQRKQRKDNGINNSCTHCQLPKQIKRQFAFLSCFNFTFMLRIVIFKQLPIGTDIYSC